MESAGAAVGSRESQRDNYLRVVPAERQHGTRTKYVHDKCRCLPCRAANSNYVVEQQRGTRYHLPFRLYYSPAARQYGVIECDTREIVFRGDREDAYQIFAELMELADPPEPLWCTPATLGQVRSHIRTLISQGVGLRRISELSGVSRSRLQEIVRGRGLRKGRPAKRLLKVATAERILAIPFTAPASAGALVPADETWRLIEELLAAGTTRGRISKAIGNNGRALQIGRMRVHQATADAIRRVHDKAWIASPALRSVCTCRGEAR